MAYSLTPADLASITDIERAFGTIRLLPKWEDIPKEFWDGNLYTQLVDSIFFNTKRPEGAIEVKPEFATEEAQANMHRFIEAHLRTWEPKHEHKTAGVGFALSHIFTLTKE